MGGREAGRSCVAQAAKLPLLRPYGALQSCCTARRPAASGAVKAARRGFGSQLIEAAVNRDLDGSAALAYPPDGFTLSLRAPLSDTSETDA